MIASFETRNDTLGWVDALRGLAILGVITVHSYYHPMPQSLGGMNVTQWVLMGQFGVQLFFLASAFTLSRSWQHRRAEHSPTRNYFLRRWFRIAPLYLLGVFGYAAIVRLFVPDFHIPADHYTFKAMAAHVLFIHGWLPFAINNIVPGGWSIGVEMSFYVLVPIFASRLRSVVSCSLAFVAAIPIAGLLAWGACRFSGSGLVATHSGGLTWPVVNNSFLYFWLPTQVPVFLLGILTFRILESEAVKVASARRKRLVSALLLVLAIAILWAISFGMGVGVDAPAFMPQPLKPHFAWLSPTLAGLAFGALLLSVALHPWRLFVNRVTIFIGKLSYSLYLVHFVGAWIFAPWVCAHVPWEQSQPWGTLLTFVAGVVTCVVFAIPVAMLTHRFVERPGIALGKRLIDRFEARALMAQQPLEKSGVAAPESPDQATPR